MTEFTLIAPTNLLAALEDLRASLVEAAKEAAGDPRAEAAQAELALDVIEQAAAVLASDPKELVETLGANDASALLVWGMSAIGEVSEVIGQFPNIFDAMESGVVNDVYSDFAQLADSDLMIGDIATQFGESMQALDDYLRDAINNADQEELAKLDSETDDGQRGPGPGDPLYDYNVDPGNGDLPDPTFPI